MFGRTHNGVATATPENLLFDNSDQLITYEQLSSWLRISIKTLERYVHRRYIPVVKLNTKTVRFRVGDVKKWLLSKSIGA